MRKALRRKREEGRLKERMPVQKEGTLGRREVGFSDQSDSYPRCVQIALYIGSICSMDNIPLPAKVALVAAPLALAAGVLAYRLLGREPERYEF